MSMSSDTPSVSPPKRRKRWRPIHAMVARPRLSAALLTFLVAGGLLLGLGFKPVQALLLSFDLGVAVFLGGMLWLFKHATPDRMRRTAQSQDAGRWGVMWIAIGLTAVVMIALGTELHATKSGGLQAVVIAGCSIVLSWLFMNVMYALHYAHGYYGDYGAEHKGLDFPGDGEPDYWDFAYFSIIIGMTFQVSDVQITSRYLRRVALVHSVIAFFFNMFIIAVSVNIVAGQA